MDLPDDIPSDFGELAAPAAPVPGNGWEVQVVAHSDFDTLISAVPDYTSFQLAKVLKDKGSGSVVINMDDPLLFPPGVTSLNANPTFPAGALTGWAGEGATITPALVSSVGEFGTVAVSSSDAGFFSSQQSVLINLPNAPASADSGTFTENQSVKVLGIASFGATITPSSYGTSDYLAAAQAWDNLTSLPWAVSITKWTFADTQLPSMVPDGIMELANTGCQFYIVFAPDEAQTSAQAAALTTCAEALISAGVQFKAILGAAPNSSGTFSSPSDYRDYVSYYAPALPPGVGVVYNPDAYHLSDGVDYYPGDTYITEIAPNFTAYAYIQVGATLDSLAALADNHAPAPIPFGLAAFCPTLASSTVTHGQWNSYVSYLQTFFIKRKNAAKANSWLLYDNTADDSVITSPSSYEVPGLQSLSTVLG